MSDLPDILLEKLDGAHRYERYIASICPWHDDTRPSLFIYEDRFYCSACGKSGTTEWLINQLDNFHVYPHQEQSYNHNPFSKWLRNNTLSEILHIANRNLPIHYLKSRGITPNIQDELHLGLLDDWITFPIMNDKGKVIGAVARAGEGNQSKSKYVLPFKQDANLLYVPNWHRIHYMNKIYVTFGILDSITLYVAGFASASTTTGKRISSSAFDNVRKRIIIIPDANEEKEAHKLASKLGWRGKVLLLQYPEDCKDINDILWKKHYTIEQLKDVIK